jgi:hypothetical protein
MTLLHGRNDAGSRVRSRMPLVAVAAMLTLILAGLIAPAAAASSPITIVVWECPPGTTADTVSLDDCTNASGGTTFTLSREGTGASMTWTTGTIEGSGAGADGLAPGTYTITQERAAGASSTSYWRCGELGGGTQAPDYTEGETLEVTIEADASYRCDWIVVPSSATPVAEAPDGTGVVSVVAWLCPSSVDQSSSYAELTSSCPEPPEGNVSASFSAWDNPPTTSHGKGTSFDDTGTAEFEFTELPAGPIVVVQTIPDGYGYSVVYCSDTGEVGAGEPKSYSERIQWVLQDDAPLTCHFFNFPA